MADEVDEQRERMSPGMAAHGTPTANEDASNRLAGRKGRRLRLTKQLGSTTAAAHFLRRRQKMLPKQGGK